MDNRMTIFGMKFPRRCLDWYRATRISAALTCIGALATLVYINTTTYAEPTTLAVAATQQPISIVDIAVLVGIVTQTVTIGFFAGAISNRLKNLESWRTEHVEFTATQAEIVVRRDALTEINRRLERLEDEPKARA